MKTDKEIIRLLKEKIVRLEKANRRLLKRDKILKEKEESEMKQSCGGNWSDSDGNGSHNNY